MLWKTMALLSVMAGPALAEAVDHGAIAELAENCQICHGPMGQGAGDIRAIAGRNPADLASQLIAMRDGTTPTTLMWRLLKPLTDAEIAALSAEIATWK